MTATMLRLTVALLSSTSMLVLEARIGYMDTNIDVPMTYIMTDITNDDHDTVLLSCS